MYASTRPGSVTIDQTSSIGQVVAHVVNVRIGTELGAQVLSAR